jgi:hypothetical protein
LVAALAAGSSLAHADVISIRGEAHGGGVGGIGLGGDLKDSAFFKNAPHGMYGVQVGAEVVFIDGWIQHHQFTDGSRIATWTQFMVGMDIQIPMGQGPPGPDKKPTPGKGYAELGFGAGFGVGTGQQVDPPLDASEVTDKAFLGEGFFGFGRHLGKLFDIGIKVPVSTGYFFKSTMGLVANDLSTHYTGLQVEALVYFRVQIKVK